jgi:hypothetical protein
MIGILERVFGCAHKKTTFPISRTRTSPMVRDSAIAAYVVCLECGTEFDYDWQAMKIGRPVSECVAALAPRHTVPLQNPAHT